jgi:transcription-repair coupling factor (superfamily II helicase)
MYLYILFEGIVTIEDLKSRYLHHERVKEIQNLFTQGKLHAFLKGFTGSADAFIAQALFHATGGTHLFILDEKEEAVFFFNDLEQLCKNDKVLFFPSSSRLPYVVEETENANILMRAEVLNSLSRDKRPTIIVTYPDALCEKVVTRKHLEKNTLEIISGKKYSIDFIDEVLLEYEFDKVDFVYEPGQFSVRGGIIDIFSYSSEDPFRVEFFGDEVESIRTFDTISQLSKQMMAKISIVPNVQDKILKESREAFFDFMDPETIVWIRSHELVMRKMELELERAEKTFARFNSPVQHLSPEELYVNPDYFKTRLRDFNLLEFGRS